MGVYSIHIFFQKVQINQSNSSCHIQPISEHVQHLLENKSGREKVN